MPEPQWWTSLLDISPELAAEDVRSQARWRRLTPHQEEEQPLTIRLGDLGQAFVANIASISPDQRRRILSILEDVQASGNEQEGTAVATGFFEVVLGAWDEGFDLRAIWEDMGLESRTYCISLNEFHGVKMPDWMSRK
ncbi:hypothetical protein EST92_16280 [Streptomyces sp. TM32]|uniref:hypothetical protein n=1 Tax=Streptomyces sp. TM32 TaxID=1652669 RepID=UPI0010128DB0|nr:hypothetical protein [Streptomyces sp. TM32]RXS81171.1 hypothetical protein EST92_16280 [Streptomyces sp. TM32]